MRKRKGGFAIEATLVFIECIGNTCLFSYAANTHSMARSILYNEIAICNINLSCIIC